MREKEVKKKRKKERHQIIRFETKRKGGRQAENRKGKRKRRLRGGGRKREGEKWEGG